MATQGMPPDSVTQPFVPPTNSEAKPFWPTLWFGPVNLPRLGRPGKVQEELLKILEAGKGAEGGFQLKP
jgi:hypothetical protein